MNMKLNGSKYTKWFALGIATAGLLMAPSAKATLTLNLSSATYISGYSASANSGSLLYQCGLNGTETGTLDASYQCSSSLNSVSYVSGTTASGTCLVLQNGYGGAFVWNLSNWNGTDKIVCNFNTRYYNCKYLNIYGQCSTSGSSNDLPSVPEPSTIIAGALLLLPLGIQAMRQLRKRQLAVCRR